MRALCKSSSKKINQSTKNEVRMVYTRSLCTFIVMCGLVGTIFYSSTVMGLGSSRKNTPRGVSKIEISQANASDKAESYSVTISVIIVSVNDSIEYTISGASTPAGQINSGGSATFTNLLPGLYAVNVTNITLGVPLLKAELMVSADFSGTSIVAFASSMAA